MCRSHSESEFLMSAKEVPTGVTRSSNLIQTQSIWESALVDNLLEDRKLQTAFERERLVLKRFSTAKHN